MNTYVCFGMKRAGTHGFIQWVISGIQGNDIAIFSNITHGSLRFYNNAFPDSSHINEWINKKENCDSRFLLVEHCPLDSMINLTSTDGTGKIVVILRNPINHVASLMAGHHPDFSAAFSQYTDKYRAALAMSRTTVNGWETVPVLFDLWFSSREERDRLASIFGFKNEDKGRTNISQHGGGSSFKEKGNALDLGVLKRWQRFTGDQQYLSIIKELRGSIEETFGSLPEELSRKISP